MTADLYREFKWSASANTLAQTVFPGIFPDLTRYQAEADQESVNQGHQPWKLSATMVAGSLASSLLTWSASSSTTLLSGGGAHDVSAIVRARSAEIVSGTINVTLSRLEGNTNGGIWEVTSVTADAMSFTSPASHVVLSNPSSVKGTGNAFEGLIGQSHGTGSPLQYHWENKRNWSGRQWPYIILDQPALPIYFPRRNPGGDTSLVCS